MQFRTTILSNGKTATGARVPDEVVAGLGPSRHPAVRATINGHTYRSSVASMGGVFMLPISAEVRAAAGVAAGEEVDVELELDTAPREVVVPPDFAEALQGDAAANAVFAGLSYSKQRRFVLSVEGAKTAETRERRITKALSDLREGKT
jgi:hypothetical protein